MSTGALDEHQGSGASAGAPAVQRGGWGAPHGQALRPAAEQGRVADSAAHGRADAESLYYMLYHIIYIYMIY